MSNILLSCLICFTVFALVIWRRQQLSPLAMMGLGWGCAWLVTWLYQSGIVEFNNEIYNVENMCIPWTLCGIAGGWVANMILPQPSCSQCRQLQDTHLNEWCDFILKKMDFFWYVSAALGVIRIIYIISTGRISSFYDYRVVYLESYFQFGLGYQLLMRLAAHIYIITGLMVVLLGWQNGTKGLNVKRVLKYFLLYSVISASQGGRIFIIDFSIFFFTPYCLGLWMEDKKSRWSRIPSAIIMLVPMLLLVCLIGSTRQHENADDHKSFYYRLLYFGEGMRATEHVLEKYSVLEGRGNGRNLLFPHSAQEISLYWSEERIRGKGYEYIVPSIIPYVYFDFGFPWGFLFWGLMMFLVQAIYNLWLCRLNILKLWLLVVCCRIPFSSILGNPVAHCFTITCWALLVYVLIFIAERRNFLHGGMREQK